MGEIVVSVKWKAPRTGALPTGGCATNPPVHRATMDGVVDTGAVMLVLPENVVAGLGLETQREVAWVTPTTTGRRARSPGR